MNEVQVLYIIHLLYSNNLCQPPSFGRLRGDLVRGSVWRLLGAGPTVLFGIDACILYLPFLEVLYVVVFLLDHYM